MNSYETSNVDPCWEERSRLQAAMFGEIAAVQADASESTEELRSRIDAATVENAEMQGPIDEAMAENAAMQGPIDEAMAENAAMQGPIDEAMAENAAMQGPVDEALSQHAAMTQRVSEAIQSAPSAPAEAVNAYWASTVAPLSNAANEYWATSVQPLINSKNQHWTERVQPLIDAKNRHWVERGQPLIDAKNQHWVERGQPLIDAKNRHWTERVQPLQDEHARVWQSEYQPKIDAIQRELARVPTMDCDEIRDKAPVPTPVSPGELPPQPMPTPASPSELPPQPMPTPASPSELPSQPMPPPASPGDVPPQSTLSEPADGSLTPSAYENAPWDSEPVQFDAQGVDADEAIEPAELDGTEFDPREDTGLLDEFDSWLKGQDQSMQVELEADLDEAWHDLGYDFDPKPVETPGGGRIKVKADPSSDDLRSVPAATQGRSVRIQKDAAEAYRAMLQAARANRISRDVLLPTSGYRSTSKQRKLWEQALKEHGSEAAARKWVAKPGGSAHHSGRAIDLWLGVRKSAGAEAQRNTAAFKWLEANAERFGFYPYKREPWHWEYNPPAR